MHTQKGAKKKNKKARFEKLSYISRWNDEP
jgi:hypothetical protein